MSEFGVILLLGLVRTAFSVAGFVVWLLIFLWLDRSFGAGVQEVLSLEPADYFVVKWVAFVLVCVSAMFAGFVQSVVSQIGSLRSDIMDEARSLRSTILDSASYGNG